MLKAVVAATAAVTIAGTSLAYAQQRDGRPEGRRWQPTIEDARAFQAARLAALRAGLVLSAEQEKHWPAFEQAMREIQQMRLARFTKMRDLRREGPPPAVDPAERMRQRATRLSESGAVLRRLADATDPLYRSLDDAQKRRFAILSRSGGPRGVWQRGGGGRDGGEPRGQRRTDVAPVDAAPQLRLAFTGRTIEAVPTVGMFGDKVAITMASEKVAVGTALLVATKAVTDEPVQFGAKATQFGNKVSTAPGAFGSKLPIGQPTGFGPKATGFGAKAVAGFGPKAVREI